MAVILDTPVPFSGTGEERAQNRASHVIDPESGRCMHCDCRYGGLVYDYPCGTEPPRRQITA